MNTKSMIIRNLISILALICLILSCNTSERSQFKIKANALGVMNEIVVVADDDLWGSIVGDTVKHYFGGIFPITPRPEPIFDLRQFDVPELNLQPLKKELRTYLIVANLNDTESPVTKMVVKDLGEERLKRAKDDPNFNTSVGRDKWAYGQLLVYVFAHGPDNLAAAIEKSFNGISSKVTEHDEVQLKQFTYARGSNPGISSKLAERFGAKVDLPQDYIKAMDIEAEDGLYWLRKDTKDGTLNIAFRQYDYTGPEMLTKEEMKRRYNLFGRFVSSDAPNTYAVINDVDLPILEFDREISTRYTKEYRGIWELENDFMGGPFISYAIVNETKGKLLVIDTFIFAPGKRKRDLMQQVDYIVKNIQW